jgi:hypothetical protein
VSSLQPPAHAGSSRADFSTLKMEAIRSSETSVHRSSIQRHIPEDGILHSHRCENLKSYRDLKRFLFLVFFFFFAYVTTFYSQTCIMLCAVACEEHFDKRVVQREGDADATSFQ